MAYGIIFVTLVALYIMIVPYHPVFDYTKTRANVGKQQSKIFIVKWNISIFSTLQGVWKREHMYIARSPHNDSLLTWQWKLAVIAYMSNIVFHNVILINSRQCRMGNSSDNSCFQPPICWDDTRWGPISISLYQIWASVTTHWIPLTKFKGKMFN